MSPKKKAGKKPVKAAAETAPAPVTADAVPESVKLMTAPAKGVKVRMYRTGLGDCFLLAFPRETASDKPRDRVFHVLIDCGVYFGTAGGAARIATIVEDIRAVTGGRLDLLVVTHEHWDHVSAFHPKQSQLVFEQKIELGKLWLAWTENLKIPLASDLHEGRRGARLALLQSLAQMRALRVDSQGNLSEGAKMVDELLSFFGGPLDEPPAAPGAGGSGALGAAAPFAAKKSVQTEEAMQWLRDVYGKDKTEFLHPGGEPLTFEGVPDARVYVLGPPEDPDLIRAADPLGDEVYHKGLAAAVQASFFAAFGVVPNRLDAAPDSDDVQEARTMSLPFDEFLQARRDEVESGLKAGTPSDPALRFFNDHYLGSSTWRQIDGDWLEAAGEFALQLDNATNNTSLAFALEIGPPGTGKVLLFPGDAQVGNWLSWFGKVKLAKKGEKERELGKEMVWTVDGRKVTAEDLLRRTVLYKVGHHGSHNATLREKGLELMGRPDGSGELVAFLPVDEHVAREKAGYGEMPLRSLMKELAIRTNGRVARNDEGDAPKDSLSTLAPIPGAPALQRSKDFLDQDGSTDLYFEYTVTPPG